MAAEEPRGTLVQAVGEALAAGNPEGAARLLLPALDEADEYGRLAASVLAALIDTADASGTGAVTRPAPLARTVDRLIALLGAQDVQLARLEAIAAAWT